MLNALHDSKQGGPLTNRVQKRKKPNDLLGFLQSGRSGSNRRHAAWEATTLPTELRPQVIFHLTV